MTTDLDELRERLSTWPDEERAAALFALQVIEDEQSSAADDLTEESL